MELSAIKEKPFLTIALLIMVAVFLVSATPALNYIKSSRVTQTISDGLEALQPIKNATSGVVPIAQKIFETPKTPEEIAEQNYQEHAHQINERFTTVFFETRLLSAGFFRITNATTGSPQDIFRVDYYVKNTQPEPHIFFPTEAKIFYNWQNYTVTEDNFTSISVEPGEERYAYALFESVPRSISGPHIVITIGTTRAFTPIFNDVIVVPYPYNVSLPLLARPRTSIG